MLRYKGENITIMKSKFGAGWGVLYGGQSVFRYNNRRIDDFHTARLIAFDLLMSNMNPEEKFSHIGMVCAGFIIKAVR